MYNNEIFHKIESVTLSFVTWNKSAYYFSTYTSCRYNTSTTCKENTIHMAHIEKKKKQYPLNLKRFQTTSENQYAHRKIIVQISLTGFYIYCIQVAERQDKNNICTTTSTP